MKTPKLGAQYGQWTVTDASPRNDKIGRYTTIVTCICGTVKEVPLWYLVNGKSKSCGCQAKEKLNKYWEKYELSPNVNGFKVKTLRE